MRTYLPSLSLKLAIACYLLTTVVMMPTAIWLLPIIGIISAYWSFAALHGRVSLPSAKKLRWITLALALLTLYLGRDLAKFELFTNIILLGYGLKFVELKGRRDLEALSLAGLLLASLSLVISSQIIDALFALLIAASHLALLLSLDNKLTHLRLSSLIKPILIVGPLSLALFLILPRLAPLWKMPNASQASTGLSDSVRAGDISELIRSDRLAFRASFESAQDQDGAWYWRAMVLDDFDGQQWSRSSNTSQKKPAPIATATADSIAYEMMLEANSQPWLASLKFSASAERGIYYRSDDSWQFELAPLNRQLKQMQWLTQDQHSELSPGQFKYLTALPVGFNEQLSDFLEPFRAYENATQTIKALEQWYLSQEFSYTLQPPLYDGLEGFLDFSFKAQQGFCVHYAQSLVVFSRALGIPARMVTGYLGGEWDDASLQVSVRDFDAHAWVEYWDGFTWQRVDPTAWISPARVTQNYGSNPDTAAQWQQSAGLWNRLWYATRLNQLRQGLDQLDYWWASWVLNFDSQRQLQLFNRLSEWLPGRSMVVATVFVLSIGLLMSSIVFLQPWRWRPAAPSTRQMRRCLRQAARQGLERKPSESLHDFGQRVAKQDPKLYARLMQAKRNYEIAHYSALAQQTQKRND